MCPLRPAASSWLPLGAKAQLSTESSSVRLSRALTRVLAATSNIHNALSDLPADKKFPLGEKATDLTPQPMLSNRQISPGFVASADLAAVEAPGRARPRPLVRASAINRNSTAACLKIATNTSRFSVPPLTRSG